MRASHGENVPRNNILAPAAEPELQTVVESGMMRPAMLLKQFGKPLLIAAIIVCILATVLHGAKDASRIPPPKMSWLGLSLLLFLLHYGIQAIGWHLILHALGQRAPLRVSLRMYYLSLLARWMPGRIWYTATRLFLAREAGLSVTAISFGIVLELIYVLVGGSLAIVLFAGGLLHGLFATGGGRSALTAVAAAVVVAGAVAIRPQTLLWLCRFQFFRKLIRRVAGEELTDRNMPRMNTGPSLLLLGYFTLFWIYSGVMFGTLAGAFLPMRPVLWQACIPAFAGSWLVGFFSIVTPAGLGAREGAMWLMLRGVMLPSQAAVLALTSRLMMLGTELVCAALAAALLRGQAGLPAPSQTVLSAGEIP